MKKKIALGLALILSFSMVGCGIHFHYSTDDNTETREEDDDDTSNKEDLNDNDGDDDNAASGSIAHILQGSGVHNHNDDTSNDVSDNQVVTFPVLVDDPNADPTVEPVALTHENTIDQASKIAENFYYISTGDDALIYITTSYDLKRHGGWLGLVPEGFTGTYDEAEEACIYYEYFSGDYVEEYYNGTYVFEFHYEYIPNGFYTMLLTTDNEPGSTIIGRMEIGKYSDGLSFEYYNGTFLLGAGGSRSKEFYESDKEKLADYFTFGVDEDYVNVYFDGFYLDESGFDNYFMYVAPQGDYRDNMRGLINSYFDRSFTFDDIPYTFYLTQYDLEEGDYTFVLALNEDEMLFQFDATKTGDMEWEFNFDNAYSAR